VLSLCACLLLLSRRPRPPLTEPHCPTQDEGLVHLSKPPVLVIWSLALPRRLSWPVTVTGGRTEAGRALLGRAQAGPGRRRARVAGPGPGPGTQSRTAAGSTSS
jgi:hypothetical protein